ncbi:MAG: hypothetical protein KME17_21155 [Cyanosarcina radialis HA8281-LM2]|nr:hypothetical protein [Cyanosarcina radialis HA8281-LM2]
MATRVNVSVNNSGTTTHRVICFLAFEFDRLFMILKLRSHDFFNEAETKNSLQVCLGKAKYSILATVEPVGCVSEA